MTNKQAIKHLEVIKGDCALVGDIRALDMAISALSAEGEYIKKSELMDHVCYCADWNMDFYYVDKDDIEKMQTYSFPGSADIEKARAEIEEYRNILIPPKTSLKNLLEVQSALNKVLEIIDKHTNTETWNGYHGTITAPKGTFDRIYEECKDSEDEI